MEKISHYLLTPNPIESQVMLHSSQTILRGPQQNRVAVFSKTAEVDGNFWKVTNKKQTYK